MYLLYNTIPRPSSNATFQKHNTVQVQHHCCLSIFIRPFGPQMRRNHKVDEKQFTLWEFYVVCLKRLSHKSLGRRTLSEDGLTGRAFHFYVPSRQFSSTTTTTKSHSQLLRPIHRCGVHFNRLPVPASYHHSTPTHLFHKTDHIYCLISNIYCVVCAIKSVNCLTFKTAKVKLWLLNTVRVSGQFSKYWRGGGVEGRWELGTINWKWYASRCCGCYHFNR